MVSLLINNIYAKCRVECIPFHENRLYVKVSGYNRVKNRWSNLQTRFKLIFTGATVFSISFGVVQYQ